MNVFTTSFLRKIHKRVPPHLLYGVLCSVFVFSSLAACGSLTGPGIEPPEHTKERTAKVNSVPDPAETVRGKEDPPQVTLQIGGAMHSTRLRPTEDLPAHVKIGTTNLNNVPVMAALQAVLADTDVTLVWGDTDLQSRNVTLMNLKGQLPVVVERICRAARLLCAYRNGALEVMGQDTFVVELPATPASISGGADTTNTIAETVQTLVGGKMKVDKTGGNILYTADAEGHERVQSYLEELRNGRPLIVLQLYIWQVTLDDSQTMGINWSQFHMPEIGGINQTASLLNNSISNFGTSALSASTGVSLGAVFSGALDANLVANFLSTQGKVQSISSPQLTFISGTSAKFENGGTQKFVSQVGTLVSGSVAGTTSSTAGVSNNTVSTEDLKTGISVTATGSYESGVIFTSLEIKTTDLVKIDSVDSGAGVKLQLPQTNDRTVSTILRVRPGDNLVLAGLQTQRDQRNRDGLPFGGTGGTLPMYSNNVLSNSETVILVRPSVVFFNDDTTKRVPRSRAKVAVVDEIPAPVPEAPKPVPIVQEIVAPTVRDPLQDGFASAVQTYQTTPGGSTPENIRPGGAIR
jgi:hypothetical protein